MTEEEWQLQQEEAKAQQAEYEKAQAEQAYLEQLQREENMTPLYRYDEGGFCDGFARQ